MSSDNSVSTGERKVGLLLGAGILLLPIVFAWFLLRKGHSKQARIIGFGWLAFALILPALARMGPSPATEVNSSASPPIAEASSASGLASPAVAEPEGGDWSYSEDKDEMRGTTSYFAMLSSENQLELDFPYGTNPATLMLRLRPSDGLKVMLSVKGQFLCSEYNDSDYVSVKFDDGSIQRFGCNEADSGTSGLLFINPERRFVTALKTAKKVVIEANYFQAGRKQLTFEVGGLKWDH